MKVLITGITGFAGSHLAELVLSKKKIRRVYGLCRETSVLENLRHLGKRVELHPCDLLDAADVFRAFKKIGPDRVFHLAGQSYAASPASAAGRTLRENYLGGLHALEAARRASPKARFLMIGSSEEYGAGVEKKDLLTENSPLLPVSVYGVSKTALDLVTSQYCRNYGLYVVRARPFNHLGPRQKESFAASSFAAQIARIEAGLQKSVIHTGDLEARRDFTDVRDVVRAYWLLLEKGVSGEVYNICSGRQVKIGRLLDICLAQCRIKIKIRQEALRLRRCDSGGAAGDSTKLRKATGWKPVIPLEKTLFDLLEYWREKIDREFGS